MPKNIVSPRTLSVHKEHEFLGRVEAAGLGDADAQLVIGSKSNELARRVVAFIRRGGYESSVCQKTAKAIMGQAYLGVDHSIEHLRVTPSKADLRTLESIPFAENVLEACKDTHILVAVFPLSILDIQDLVDRSLFYFKDQAWYRKELLAKDNGLAHWALVRKYTLPHSTSKSWQDQQSLLGKDDETPTTRVLVYMVILNYLVTGVKLLPNGIYARVSDLESVGRRVIVGYFDDKGLAVGGCDSNDSFEGIGIVSAKKPTCTSAKRRQAGKSD